MKPLIIANWKMNITFEESIKFCTDLVFMTYTNSLIVCPPSPYLAYLSDRFKSIEFSAQDVSSIESYGAYTGEYSSFILKQCSIHYSLIGHSERRNLFGESNDIIRQKVTNCVKAGVTPIVCVGEPWATRLNGSYKEFILQQLMESLPNNQEFSNLIIGYEPIWSIGTGLIPSNEELIEIFEIINLVPFGMNGIGNLKYFWGLFF